MMELYFENKAFTIFALTKSETLPLKLTLKTLLLLIAGFQVRWFYNMNHSEY